MKRDRYTELLTDVLHDPSLEAFREESLRAGLAGVRRERRKRVLTRVWLVATVCLLPAWMLLQSQLNGRDDGLRPALVNVPQAAPAAVPREEPSGIEEIGDAELLALFPDATVALIGKEGEQRLLVMRVESSNKGRQL